MQCLDITKKWNTNRNQHFQFFKNNQINICETCFREGACHINDCILEKTLIQNSITEALANTQLHTIQANQLSLEAINKHAEDYFFNMDFIMRNLVKMKKIVSKYITMFEEVVVIKKIYNKIIKQLFSNSGFSEDSGNIELSNSGISGIKDSIVKKFIDLGRDKFDVSCEEMFGNIDIFNGYYLMLKSKNIKLTDDKIYSK